MSRRFLQIAGCAAGILLCGTSVGAQALESVDAARERRALISKLSSDINKVDHSIEVTKELLKGSPDAPYLADL